MKPLSRLGGCFLGVTSLFLTACGGGVVVDFAEPFPQQVADMLVFPARHRGVYTAADSVTSLCIGPTAVWRQELCKTVLSRQQLGALHRRLTADSTYQDDQARLHYLRLVSRDSVRDSWLECDTVFTLAGPDAGHLRHFQGHYYLNSPGANGSWWVQRLKISGQQVIRQTLGQDTLRLLVLDTATVQRRRDENYSYFHLAPAPGPQTRRVGRYAGLWETAGAYVRRN